MPSTLISRFLYLISGLVLGSVLGGCILYAYAERESSATIERLRQSEQSAVTELGGLADSIGRLQTTGSAIKDNAQRSRILIDGLRKVIGLFPDVK